MKNGNYFIALGLISITLLVTSFIITTPEAESYLAIPPTSAFSTFLSDTFGINISAVFSTDSATFSGGDLTFFPGNQTINFGPNATALFEQLNSTVFSLNGSIPVLIEGDQIDLTAIGNLTEISLEDCLQDQFLLYDSGVWTCVDLSAINGTGSGTNTTAIIQLDDVFFNAEEGTVDDLDGVDCVNDITYNFLDQLDVSQYRRQAVEFCGSGDIDDNVTWIYIVQQQYNSSDPTDFDFRLFWTDDGGGGVGTFLGTTTNDNEEDTTDGSVSLGSPDLELHDAGGDEGYTAVRFTGITIPNSATILSATIQYHVDEVLDNSGLNIRFRGEDIDNSPSLSGSAFDISSRTETSAFFDWFVPPWLAVHDEGAAQLTPDLSSIVQEIVDRPGWGSGNAMTIMIKNFVGAGERTAESSDGEPTNAPELFVTYSNGASPGATVCFEFSMFTAVDGDILDPIISVHETVCTPRMGEDQLTITTFDINSTTHDFEAEDYVVFRIVRPDDFVPDDFEGDVFLFGSELKWQN